MQSKPKIAILHLIRTLITHLVYEVLSDEARQKIPVISRTVAIN